MIRGQKMNYTYIATIIVTSFAMIVLSIFTLKNSTLAKTAKIGITGCAIIIIVGALSECLGEIFERHDASFRAAHAAVKFIELSITPLAPVVFATSIYRSKARWYFYAIVAINAIIEFLSMFFGITFYVNARNVYIHCKFYWLYHATIFINAVYFIYAVIVFNTKYQSCDKSAPILILMLVFAGEACQTANRSIKIVWLSVAVGMVLFYIYYCTVILQTNALTGLLNRRSFDHRISWTKEITGILLFDVNDFKAVNDNHGHQFGDQCLITIAHALNTIYNKIGWCYRIGGDEFCVILKKTVANINEYTDNFHRLLDKKRLNESRLPTVAVGYEEYDPSLSTIAEVIARADEKMYADKRNYKD